MYQDPIGYPKGHVLTVETYGDGETGKACLICPVVSVDGPEHEECRPHGDGRYIDKERLVKLILSDGEVPAW